MTELASVVSHPELSGRQEQPGGPCPASNVRQPTLQLLERAFAVLECFTVEHDQWKMSELARACELPVPSAHRILAALERLGYVTRDPLSRSYRLGPAAARLAGRSWGVGALRPIALPILRRVTAATGHGAAVAVASDDASHAIVAAVVKPPSGAGRIDAVADLHGDALGLVLLAQLDEREVKSYLDSAAVPHALVRRQLSQVRRRGWSVVPAAERAQVWSAAVPVLDQTATFQCSLGVYANGECLDRAALSRALSVLRAAATGLGSRLRAAVVLPGQSLRAAG